MSDDSPSKEDLSTLIATDSGVTVAEDIAAAIEEAEAETTTKEAEAKSNGADRGGDTAEQEATQDTEPGDKGDAALSGEEEAKKAAPAGDDTAATIEAPAHWPEADKDMFKGQTPEAQAWLLEKSKSLEAGYEEKFQEIAGLKKAIDPWSGYLQQIGATPELAIQYLIGAEYQLRTGTPAQKREALLKIAQDYDIDLGQADGGEGEEEPSDPAVKALQDELTNLRGLVTSQVQTQAAGQQAVAESDIQAFAEEKTEAGQPAHPHFDEVVEDMVMLARGETAQGRKPNLKDLYERAIWSNPAVRAKLMASEKETDAKQRATEAKDKEQKARQAASSVSGAPAGAGQPEAKQNLREEITEAMNTAS